ncbi:MULTISPECIES: tetratricopeptide repeat protein [unclassified Agarivorans]|nr:MULTISPECIES: tetratricopeptide repeat protein [unclassified Agarivorans]MDO6685869.1 hypothetical protein [Agarivorans sp. 3_MG-2023]MDO6716016.1 hypothetical protein [Agarivorans sp. 2_MG-2023]
MTSNFSTNELFHLAIDAANNQRNDKALSYLKELVERSPEHHQGKFLLASTYASLGMFNEAIVGFKDCLRTEPEFSLARFQLALSLLATGQTEDGAVELKELTSATPEYLINFAKGILFSLDNKKDEAIEQLKLGISINNENPSLNGDMEGVIEALETMPNIANNSNENPKPAAELESNIDDLSTHSFLLGAYKQ